MCDSRRTGSRPGDPDSGWGRRTRFRRARPEECFFWATHTGAELDLLVVRGPRRVGFEFKRTSAPRTTKSMHSLRVLLGLLIVVQGFETSRFMGDEFDADTRIRTMRWAQLISSVVYVVFFALMTVLFRDLDTDTGITAIIGLVGHVALILPMMLTVGAVASQFSASVADSVGCAGLLEDVSHEELSLRHAYPLIAIVSITITWSANVFRIITLASQAFALFYLAQACVALSIAFERRDLKRRPAHIALFFGVALFCLSVVRFGIPSG